MSNEQKSDTDQLQFWQMVIETWQSSGLSVRQFCAKEGLTEASFYFWRKKFAGDNKDANNQSQIKSSQSEFIEVAIPQNNSAAIELVLTSGNTLKIPAGVDSGTLSMVLSVIRASGLC